MKEYQILGSGKKISELNSLQISNLEAELILFEKGIANLWDSAKIPYFVHLSGGNEKQLIDIFKKINPEDYVFSTHRSHYHYLLKRGYPEKLEKMILDGKSIHIFDSEINFLSSGIVAGTPSIAAGIAKSLKLKNKNSQVWCFIGDGAEDEGHFYEAVRYVDGHDLPCTFIIENNNRSVQTPCFERYGNSKINWPACVIEYEYSPTYPHVGTGKYVSFSNNQISNGGLR